jgi:hypothetical protein
MPLRREALTESSAHHFSYTMGVQFGAEKYSISEDMFLSYYRQLNSMQLRKLAGTYMWTNNSNFSRYFISNPK